METVTFNIPSISCSICAGKINEGMKTLEGVDNIKADLKSQSLTVVYDPAVIKPQDIKNTISSMGYEVI